MPKKYLDITKELQHGISFEGMTLIQLKEAAERWIGSYGHYDELWFWNEGWNEYSPDYTLMGKRKETKKERSKRIAKSRDEAQKKREQKMKRLESLAKELGVKVKLNSF